ncbi:MAG: hypothetical protein ABL986_06605 [Vicinamibacterales bacterium]
MRILFLSRHHGYFRNYESVLRELAARGHTLHLAAERDEEFGGRRLVETLASECPGITFGAAPARADDDWAWVAGRLRLGLDYLRYQHPIFRSAYQLRLRARERTPGAFVALGRVVGAVGWLRRLVIQGLRALERAIPGDVEIGRYIDQQRAELLLLTPLIDLGSSQIDYLRAARGRGIPSALCVWSWDHLSSKALIREQPDRVFVWNDIQRREAVELHGVDPNRVIVTGAQCFDQWFNRSPSRDRETFCRDAGLDASRRVILYVCSALFAGSPSEAEFVVEWLRRLRASALPEVRDAQVLVRPHPSRTAEWDGVDVTSLDAVIWGSNPVDVQARADYFDSLYYSDAVVGINTSAFIEAGIVGRPVHAVVVPEFAANQGGTVHFQYLVDVAGGLVSVGHGLDDHIRQLHASLVSRQAGPRPFIQAFLRPHGLDVAATPIFVEHVEAMQQLQAADGSLRATPVWRWVVGQLARTRTSQRLEGLTLSWRERESVEHTRDEQQRKALRRAEERAASDPVRLEALRERAMAFEQERQRRAARRERTHRI